MLKRDGFSWNGEAKDSFETLKKAMASAPSLALLNFNLPIEIETNASSTGIGVVLQ